MLLLELKKQHALLYKPFSPLADVSDIDGSPQIAHIEDLLEGRQWHAAREASLKLIQDSLDGLHYLQTYDRFLIKALVTAAYTGWIAFASLYIFRPKDNIPASYFVSSPLTTIVNISGGATILILWTLFLLQKSPVMFYVYSAFPCYFWHRFLVQIIPVIRFHSGQKKTYKYVWFLVEAGMVAMALLGMVVRTIHRSCPPHSLISSFSGSLYSQVNLERWIYFNWLCLASWLESTLSL